MSFCLKETITYSATGSHPHVVIPNTFNLKEFSFFAKSHNPNDICFRSNSFLYCTKILFVVYM